LISVPGDPKIYKLENGIKRWITTAFAFNRNGFRWDQVTPVNVEELNFYTTGDDIQ